jgi:anti-sigma regulatory factor (Ser/Thr protein kinase)
VNDAPTSSPFRLLEIGQIVRPAEGETASGDAVLVQRVGGSVVVAVADALGHGDAASAAATACIVAIQKHIGLPLDALFSAVNDALRGGRGAVAAVARFDPGARTVTLAALGNIAAVLCRGGRGGARFAPLPTPGVLGRVFRKVRIETAAFDPGDFLILHTDGVAGLIDVFPLRLLSAQQAALDIVSSYRRPLDDAACVVVRALTGMELTGRKTGSEPESTDGRRVLPPAHCRVAILRDSDAQVAAHEARQLAVELGMGQKAQWEVALATAELATNARKHGIEGIVVLRRAPPPGEALIVEVTDCGAGLMNLERNLSDRVSDGVPLAGVPRRSGTGLGVGLGTVYRLMDEVHVEAIAERGTRVIARKRVVREDAEVSRKGAR